MMRALKLWLLRWREGWIEDQVEVVEDQIHNAPIRRGLLMEELRRVRVQLAQLHTGRELLSQALARREVETRMRPAQPRAQVASQRQSDYR